MKCVNPQVPETANSLFAVEVVQRLRTAHFESLWAGGCVRDLVMGNSPEDYDVATSATPNEVRELFGHRHTLSVGAAFGVIVVLDRRGGADPVEVATFRTDATYSDGRRPDSVTFSTAQEDAQRRDFTINGMFFDPLSGKIIDYVEGQVDIHRGVVRAIGLADARIAEDKLRMLRAVRFAARFGFELESQTRDAIQRHSASLAVVSGERIAIEVQKTLQTSAVAWAVDTWASTGLLQCIVPELAWAEAREPALQMLEASVHCGLDWRARMAALLLSSLDASRLDAALHTLKARLKWSSNDFHAIQFALRSQHVLEEADERPWSQVQPLLIQADIGVSLELLAARSQSETELQAIVRWLHERLEWPREHLDPPPLLTGADLIGLGLSPGPTFRTALAEARALQLDGKLLDKADALAWLNM